MFGIPRAGIEDPPPPALIGFGAAHQRKFAGVAGEEGIKPSIGTACMAIHELDRCRLDSFTGDCAASSCNCSIVTTPRTAGASMIRDIRCGHLAVESPLHAKVPYSFQIRAGLWTDRSTATASVPCRWARASRHRSINPPSAAGRSAR